MSRERSFVEEDVRAAVLTAFLKGGYAATSLSDIEIAAGLGRRSLYDSFGDKRALFLRALKDFRADAETVNLSPLADPQAGIDAIDAALSGLVRFAPTPKGRLGCLICNTAREPVAADPDVAREINGYFKAVRSLFQRALENAQRGGGFSADRSPESAAHFLLGVLVSICVLARARAPRETLEKIKEEALRALKS